MPPCNQTDAPCPNNETLKTILASHGDLATRIEQLSNELAQVRELLAAWNNAKGFLAILHFLGNSSGPILKLAAILAAIWIFMKTGKWTPE